MTLTGRTVHELLAAFRASDPTPGGGSAAALAGATGASLLVMVAGLPKPAAAAAEDVQRLHAAGARCSDSAVELEALIVRDAEAYDAVMAAYRRPKGTDDEQASRSAAIQDALRGAVETPLAVMRACAAALAESAIVARLGNQNAASDVTVARELLRAGLRGAHANVEINLGSVKDQEYVDRVRAETADLAERVDVDL